MIAKNGAGVLYIPKHARDPVTRQRDTSHPDCERGFIFYENLKYGEETEFKEGDFLPVRYFNRNDNTLLPGIRYKEKSVLTDARDLKYDVSVPVDYIMKCFHEIIKILNLPERLEFYSIQGVLEKWAGLE